MRKRFDFAQNTLAFGVFNTRSEQLCKEKKDNHTRTGSPPLPLADEVTAAAAHAGRFRRAPAPHSTAPSSPCSAPPSPPARFSSPGLYRPLATTPPWLRFRAVLRRRVSGGPRSLKEKHFSYAPESGVRYDGVYSLRTVGGRLVFSAVGRSAYRVPPRRLLPPPTWDLTARSPPGTPTMLESEQTPLARGHRSRVQDGDGAKEDSRTSIDCIVAAVPMEWRGSNHSEMRNQYNNRT
ncbi:uncharacterized protein LOC125551393 isoform X5 [Triticum urartu]|uniref:uncharacterized protein LOC125551393 isoform X5 n=1 Tax=Triticum urartu TaxID=4572 RepID=UPI0020434780|nr:uncharacterized protein LOC125551393 isoform X5 [Triticum urartu]XP_048570575.1 uncharacterized protein LOC125551393 isoform X5 [Triticum urartu]